MFIEYMAIKDKKEAESVFDASANIKPTEKDELYIVKEKDEYQAIIKIKKFRKRYNEQKWFLSLTEKGVKAKREMTKTYLIELLVTIISVLLVVGFGMLAFMKPDMMAVLLWFALVAFLIFLYTTWKRFFKPSVSLKIFLIRII